MVDPPRNDQRMNNFFGLRRVLVVIGAATLIIPACADGDAPPPRLSRSAPRRRRRSSTTPSGPVTKVAPTTTTVMITTSTATEATGRAVYFLLEELNFGGGSPGPFLVPVYREAPVAENAAETSLRLFWKGRLPKRPPVSRDLDCDPQRNDFARGCGGRRHGDVDLSGEFDDGGGSFGMFARLAQVVYTVTGSPRSTRWFSASTAKG